MSKIGSSQIISTFDAKSGYWQIPVAEEDRRLTAFITRDGLYEWVRMPFTLKNAGATFVTAAKSVLKRICDFSESYVDDIGLGSDGWSQHLNHIGQFLAIIKEVRMTLSIEKCEFAKPEVKFVGHFVGSGGRRPDPDMLQGLDKMSLPQTKRELRKLLGAFGYYRDYIEHFAHIVKPLTDLISNKVPNQLPWEECHQQAYEILRSKLRSAHVLRIPRIGEPFVLHTDASGVAVGATLGQLDQDGVQRPLVFASHKLSGPQCAWATIEREAYAIIWALAKFRDIVMDRRSVWSVITTLSNISGTVLRKALSCCGGHLLARNLTWTSRLV